MHVTATSVVPPYKNWPSTATYLLVLDPPFFLYTDYELQLAHSAQAEWAVESRRVGTPIHVELNVQR